MVGQPKRLNPKSQIDYLYELSQQRSDEGRAELYLCVADLFERTGAAVTPRERDLMKQILTSLTREVELAVRRSLAERLAGNTAVPRDLVGLLIDDRIEVAQPILLRSEVLKSADLIAVIRHKSRAYQLAVAARRQLDAGVSAALVETGDEEVIVALLENHGAMISDAVFAYLADESRSVLAFQGPLLHREDLPKAVARSMYTWVSAALRQYIARHYAVDVNDLDDAIADTVKSLDAKPGTDENPLDPSTLVVNAVAAVGQLTEDFLLRALGQGRVTIFEIGLATLLRLDRALARQLLYDPGWENLAIACKALGFSADGFCLIQSMTGETREPTDAYAEALTDTPRRFYKSLNVEDSAGVVRRWRRGADLTGAIGMFSNL